MTNIELKKALEAALEAVQEADELNENSTSPSVPLRNTLITIELILKESIVSTAEELL